ncbi:Uu.00g143820.m01.CDS01 [Anthostomella pinea]|uniref:Uu.00g143820.m01.CDS01 n=1 Tax=Anthostomella pinea TaxID=933095 RepID=A0AAI8VQP7_9PEZI|nr:Uu.00g143820.m01.CDS01 [Anthostomella pinea]
MDKVRKTFFDPLATSKARIREILEPLPVGSAHPFSPERILLCRTEHGIDDIDISSYPEDFFFNAVDLGQMGEVLLKRMANFTSQLGAFAEFQILQAPTSTFSIPIVSGKVTILAVSERYPTYYDFCLADASYNTSCYNAQETLAGVSHSGDIIGASNDLLQYIRINKDSLTKKEICVFISGYRKTQITRFLGTNPALMVADHIDKVLYIIPVPLDAATIGDATICCPMVVKPDGDSLMCSILPTATTDRNLQCDGSRLVSPCFPEAIQYANFTGFTGPAAITAPTSEDTAVEAAQEDSNKSSRGLAKDSAVFMTHSTTLPPFLDSERSQLIRFGTGIEFQVQGQDSGTKHELSSVVLPCILGSMLEGPVLLATGTVPLNSPVVDDQALRDYYEKLKHVVIVVDDRMTDNARNLATCYRINALFIVQLRPEETPTSTDGVLSLLNSANINAVTALSGPQSLVLVQVSEKFYFYRGIANQAHLDTSRLAFGSDVTSILESAGVENMLEPKIGRVVSLDEVNRILLPASGQFVRPADLQGLFQDLSVDQIRKLEHDITASVPQLQVLLSQNDLQELSKALVGTLSAKVSDKVTPLRKAYIKFLTTEHRTGDATSVTKKNRLLGELRKSTKEIQKALEAAISSLANMMSAQTSSKRTHDLKRLARQTQIQVNVEAAKSMTFETMAGYLETHAADMGVMLLNIETAQYAELLGNLEQSTVDASACCNLDSRVLHLEGFDAGIIIEQSQSSHDGPLKSLSGPTRPTLALPYLSSFRGGSDSGSMLAWVCWDEFVNLTNPYTVRWMEKCNEAHIAALRILMRETLSQAVASREHDFHPGSSETGRLMSALLMTAMSKLAAMRTTHTVVSEEAEDTVTRLMRGLFGNLLTMAGSGVRPLSMVWQLFGLNPQWDIPATHAQWFWYEKAVALYPYTGWPLKQFHGNLEKLLDGAIVRVVTKAEDVQSIKANRVDELIKFCKLRNIQLEHSRTIITIMMRMLSGGGDVGMAAMASRLLDRLPSKLAKQTRSYTSMIRYLQHFANGGERRLNDDLVAASVYTKRSATFGELKAGISEACADCDWEKVKEGCEEIIAKHAEIAALWKIDPEKLKIQNIAVYKSLLEADLAGKAPEAQLTKQVHSDAEKNRVPWQVGKGSQFGDNIEPLDEALVHEVLTGEKLESATDSVEVAAETNTAVATTYDFTRFKSSLKPQFVDAMQRDLSFEDVCNIIKVPADTMRVFVKALNPGFACEDLGRNFKRVTVELIECRSNRLESCPTKRLLERESKMVAIGAKSGS